MTGTQTHRTGWLVLLLVGILWSVWPQPASAAANNGLRLPATGAVAGTISIQGVANHPAFRKWQVDLLVTGDANQALFLAMGESPVPQLTELLRIDTTRFPDGAHKLRLRVVYEGLNYDEFYAPITIANHGGAVASASSDSAAASAAADSQTGDASKPANAENKPAETASKPAPPQPEIIEFRSDAPADGKKWIEVSIADQTLTAWQGDVAVFQTKVSTGKPGYRTLPGSYKVYRKYEKTRMTGPDYNTPDVPWTMYYYRGFALHGAYWHNNFGRPVSHGCVNLRVPEAKALFEWAPMGTEVVVH